MIRTAKSDKKFLKHKKRSDWWFSITKLRFMRKKLRKLYYETLSELNIDSTQQLQVCPEDFIKLSNETIERGLNLFVTNHELEHWEQKKVNEKDVYLLIFPNENRSQSRFSEHKSQKISRIPEIDLNSLQTEPINTVPADNVYTSNAQSNEQKEQEQTKPAEAQPKQEQVKPTYHSPWDDDDDEFEHDYDDEYDAF